jgi:hypothetical protein
LNAAVAFFYFFIVFNNVFYDSSSFVFTAEIWPSHLRSEGVTIAAGTFYLFGIAYDTPASLAFANIGWIYYLAFIMVSTIISVVVWFTSPETACLTLVEIGVQFGENPKIRFDEIVLNGDSGEEAASVKVEDEVKTKGRLLKKCFRSASGNEKWMISVPLFHYQ